MIAGSHCLQYSVSVSNEQIATVSWLKALRDRSISTGVVGGGGWRVGYHLDTNILYTININQTTQVMLIQYEF